MGGRGSLPGGGIALGGPLRAGDLLEIRPAEEILATLDADGRLDGMPFMPEMLQFCGRRVRVESRAHKTCDSAFASGYRRLEDTVHLRGLRCDGGSHGGCQAACLLFWKTAWLRRVEADGDGGAPGAPAPPAAAEGASGGERAAALLARTTTRRTAGGEPVYTCQATELRAATRPLRWWDPRQYVQDLTSRNVAPAELLAGLLVLLFNKLQAANRRFLPRFAPIAGGRRYPFVAGRLDGATPAATLGLQPGELVRIKPKAEIERTLDRRNRNRGLLFDGEMSRYCGQTARVRARVERIIDERSGRMRHLPTDCIILEGVTCTGRSMQFCPRRIYDYWREIWLERVS
jgi:hypothetical protein